MTNGDKIRAMTDKKIAEHLCGIIVCEVCPACDLCNPGDKCILSLFEWLKEEAEK